MITLCAAPFSVTKKLRPSGVNAATFSRPADAGRVLGVAWAVFGIPHFAYHATHFGHMPLIDVLGNIFSLGASVLLGIALMLPVPRPAGAVTFPSASQQESRT